MRRYRRYRRWNWKRISYTGGNPWQGFERFLHVSKNGKKWYKINFGFRSPYDSELYKWDAYDTKTGKFIGWK